MVSAALVTIPGSQVCVRRFESPLDPQAGWPGRYINVQHCGGMSMVLLQLKDPQELFVKRRKFLPGSWFPSCDDMTYRKFSEILAALGNSATIIHKQNNYWGISPTPDPSKDTFRQISANK